MQDKNSKATKMRLRANYQPSTNVPAPVGEKGSRTKQQFAEECDINNIVKKAYKNGMWPTAQKLPEYGDFTTGGNYQEAMNLILKAQEQFDALPSRTRERFGNDPAQFLDFASDGRNAEEMAKMGLMDPKAVERVQKAKESKIGVSTATPQGEPEGSTLKKGNKKTETQE